MRIASEASWLSSAAARLKILFIRGHVCLHNPFQRPFKRMIGSSRFLKPDTHVRDCPLHPQGHFSRKSQHNNLQSSKKSILSTPEARYHLILLQI